MRKRERERDEGGGTVQAEREKGKNESERAGGRETLGTGKCTLEFLATHYLRKREEKKPRFLAQT